MNLQDMITYREYPEKESKSNINFKENNINTNRNSQGSYNNSNEMKNNRNNSSNCSYTRSNKIEKEIENKFDNNNIIDIEIHSNNMNDNYNLNNQNNINYNIPIKRTAEIEKNNENEEKKDIIDELIEKIKNKQEIGIKKEIPRKTLSELDDELKFGLEQLRKIQTKSNRSLYNAQKESGIKYTRRNSLKFNEVMAELNKVNVNSKNRISRNMQEAFFNLKNIKIVKPNIYFHSLRKNNKTIEINKRKNENKFYFSSIDGNVIINGERKNPDTLQILIKKLKNPRNRSMCINDNLNLRRSNSVDLRTIGNKSVYPYFGIRKINNYNKNYFMDELNKIDNLLL